MKKFFATLLLMVAACVSAFAEQIVPEPGIYMVGDAAPSGWSINNPTALIKVSENIYEFKGYLKEGKQFKFYTKKGDWSNPMIVATTEDSPLTKAGLQNQPFNFNSWDLKWKVIEGGYYKVTLDIESQTISAEYLGETAQSVTPLGDIYIAGYAVNKTWNLSDIKKLTNNGDNTYTYEGHLYGGNNGFQFRFINNDYDLDAVSLKPANQSAAVCLSTTGFAESGVDFRQNPDINWWVETEGEYTITLDLNTFTVSAVCNSYADPNAIVPSPGIYIIGDAAPCGWSTDVKWPTALIKKSENVYEYKGYLKEGKQFKFYTMKGSWSNPAIVAATENSPLTKTGFQNQEFVFKGQDYKWKVMEGGYYKLTLDLVAHTITAEYLGDTFQSMLPFGDIYVAGYAVNKTWNLADIKPLTNNGDNTYTYSGLLNGGDSGYQFRFITNTYDFDALSLKPANKDAAVCLSTTGFAESGVDYRQNPDKNWWVETTGYYTITLNLNTLTVTATYDGESGVEGIGTENNVTVVGEFDLLGRPVKDAEGMFVIQKLSNGTTRKVIKH